MRRFIIPGTKKQTARLSAIRMCVMSPRQRYDLFLMLHREKKITEGENYFSSVGPYLSISP